MIDVVLPAVILMGLLGIIFGLILAYASKKFEVKGSDNAVKLEEALPGYNCGACGYPGCSAYAEALASGEVTDVTLCKPGRQEVIDKINVVLKE